MQKIPPKKCGKYKKYRLKSVDILKKSRYNKKKYVVVYPLERRYFVWKEICLAS